MIDHARINRLAESAKLDIRKTCKEAIESSNRSFGQMIRQHRERMERVMMETENMGDEDLLCCSGIRWGISDGINWRND